MANETTDPTLTDAQVAALLASDGEVESNNLYEVELAHPTLRDDLNPAQALFALALEVHQSRQRRCGNCGWWVTPSTCGNYPYGECDLVGGACDGKATAPDWFCADFTPKEPA